MEYSQRQPGGAESVVVAGDSEGRLQGALTDCLGEPVARLEDTASDTQATVVVVAGRVTRPLASLSELELVVSLMAGVEQLLSDARVPPGVPIVRANDRSLQQAMVESVLLHVLSAHRGVLEYRRAEAEQRWRPQPQPLATMRTVGVLGLGNLGRSSAVAIAGLGFPVVGWSREAKRVPGVRSVCGADGLREVLTRSQIVVCLLPLTPTTMEILNAERLALMPAGAFLINVARGALVAEQDLLAELDSGRLGGAILDVFAEEPLPAEHPFWRHPRVAVYPHVAADPDPVTGSAAAADLIRAHRRGERLTGVVDRDRGY